jgi:predicted RNA-binding Zn ribbon-like protein
VELGDAELEQALDVRGGLRALVRTNLLGGRIDAATAERLDRAAEAALLRVRFDSLGENRFETAADGFEGALGHLFRIVAVARLGELWPRLKVCPFEPCGRCFYDASRYGTRKWCSMKQCGNVIKGRVYRRRNRRRGGQYSL